MPHASIIMAPEQAVRRAPRTPFLTFALTLALLGFWTTLLLR